ncbi:MAG: molecular chaperone HtpG, partial [Clostridia bacterium]|nr:molecular chaperone HtpG [Clostridia bacterium]
FFDSFGVQLKFGVYDGYGANKENLKDLLLFRSSREGKFVTLKEYVERMPESQTAVYYACGETREKIETLPQTDTVKAKGYELLYLTDNVDEFALKMLGEYGGKRFVNVCDNDFDLSDEAEKKELKEQNESAKDMLSAMKETLQGKVNDVRFTGKLKNHPVCLTSEGGISLEMEKVLNSMPNAKENAVKAQLVLEINAEHKITEKLKTLFDSDKDTFGKYTKLLYDEACLISGKGIDNALEHSNLVCELMTEVM